MSPDHLRIRNPGELRGGAPRPGGRAGGAAYKPVDPVCEVRPAISQVDDVLGELKATIDCGDRALVIR